VQSYAHTVRYRCVTFPAIPGERIQRTVADAAIKLLAVSQHRLAASQRIACIYVVCDAHAEPVLEGGGKLTVAVMTAGMAREG